MNRTLADPPVCGRLGGPLIFGLERTRKSLRLWSSVRLVAALLATVPLAASCSAPEPQSPPAPTASAASVAAAASTEPTAAAVAEPQPIPIPTECAEPGGEICTPPADFVERLCAFGRPNIALTLFGKGTPWTRAYIGRSNLRAWYASAGGRSEPAKLGMYEEVLIIADRQAGAGGIRVSGAGSFDVFRWDGTCVSVMSDEVSMRPLGPPKVATIRWKRLDEVIQEALEQDKRIRFRNDRRRKACKGAAGPSTKFCAFCRASLSLMVAQIVRQGGELPSPQELPPE